MDGLYGKKNLPGKTKNSKAGKGRDTARALEHAQNDVEVKFTCKKTLKIKIDFKIFHSLRGRLEIMTPRLSRRV